jgi:hypothetical protein
MLYNGTESPYSITMERLLRETIAYLDDHSDEITRLESLIVDEKKVFRY